MWLTLTNLLSMHITDPKKWEQKLCCHCCCCCCHVEFFWVIFFNHLEVSKLYCPFYKLRGIQVFWRIKSYFGYLKNFSSISVIFDIFKIKKKKFQVYFGHFITGILVLLNILMVCCQFRRFQKFKFKFKFKFKNMSPTLFNFFIHVRIDGPICAASLLPHVQFGHPFKPGVNNSYGLLLRIMKSR